MQTQFQVDYNTIGDDCVIGLQRRATGPTDAVHVGSTVQTFDLDGNVCSAKVVAATPDRFTLKLALDTFR